MREKQWHDWNLKLPTLAVLLIAALCWPAAVLADGSAVFQMVPQEGVKIVLVAEDCRLKEVVTNLPGRAIWEEGGKVYEGCFGVDTNRGMVRMYFADKTVVSAYMQEFTQVTDI